MMKQTEEMINWDDFSRIEMRAGTILSAEVFKEARNPAYLLMVDFGEYGIRKSSAQITKLYETDELVGKQVIGIINFPPKQIAAIKSQCLILGVVNDKEVTLLSPDKPVENGLRIG